MVGIKDPSGLSAIFLVFYYSALHLQAKKVRHTHRNRDGTRVRAPLLSLSYIYRIPFFLGGEGEGEVGKSQNLTGKALVTYSHIEVLKFRLQ